MTVRIDRFLGLDVRGGDRPLGSLAQATNVLLDSRGSLVRRPGLVRRATLPAGTAGLYVHEDTLRVAAPDGTPTDGLFPTVFVDYLPAATLGGRVQAVRLASGRRAVWIEQVNGSLGAIGITTGDAATAGGQLLNPGFAPVGLLGLGGRLYSLDPETARLRWSGLDSPDDNDGLGWVTSWDPAAADVRARGGYVSLAQGSSEARALAEYRGDIAVFLRSAVLLFSVGGDGVDALQETVGGPGTRHPVTVQPVSGDLLYLDPGHRFRSLATDRASVLPAEQTLGDPVAALTRAVLPPAYTVAEPAFAIYARSLGAYIAGWRNQVLTLTVSPGHGAQGWTLWTFPDGLVFTGAEECRGTVYLRSATGLWSLEPNAPDDEVADGDHRPIRCDWMPADLVVNPTTMTAHGLSLVLSGSAQVAAVVDGRVGTQTLMTGSAPYPSRRLGCWRGKSLTMQVSVPHADPAWRCDACAVDVRSL